MSELFKTTLIEPSIISEITPIVTYAVESGPARSSYTSFNADSVSSSSIVFSVNTPNQSILIDRSVKMSAKMTLKFSIGQAGYLVPFVAGVDDNSQATVFEYAKSEAYQSYPLNSLINSSTLQINNATVSTNNMDIKDILATVTDHRSLNKKNSSTPSYYDSLYGEYKDCVGATNSPLNGVGSSSLDDCFQGRGNHVVSMLVEHYNNANVLYPVDPVVGAPALPGQRNAFGKCLKPAAAGDTWIIYLTGYFTENFLAMSPLLSTLSHDQQGAMGITNVDINLNIDQQCRRVFSTGKTQRDAAVANSLKPAFISNIAIERKNGLIGFEEVKLHFNFLSLQSSQLARIKEPSQVLNYMKFDRHITSSNNTAQIAALDAETGIGGKGTIISNSLSLSTVPDRIFIAVRVPLQSQNSACASSFLAIEGCTINFDNGESMLATCDQVDLFNLSVRNGSNQTYNAFKGQFSIHDSSLDQQFKVISSLGSVLVVNPVQDLNLPEFYTNGSIGQFNLVVNVSIANYHDYPIQPELVLVVSNSGVFKIQAGVSSVYTSLLTTKQVMDAKSGGVSKISTGDYAKLLGGVSPAMNGLANFRRNKNKPYPDGSGMSASGMSASGVSGGGISGSGRKIDRLL
jgi:hypothetical protein